MLPWAHDSRVPYNTGDRKQIHIPHHLRRLKDGLVCTDKPGVSPKDKIEPASKRAASALTHGAQLGGRRNAERRAHAPVAGLVPGGGAEGGNGGMFPSHISVPLPRSHSLCPLLSLCLKSMNVASSED